MDPVSPMMTHHVAISVRDLKSTLDFYRRFGFELVLRWDAPDDSLSIAHLVGAGGVVLEVFRYSANADELMPNLEVGNDLERIGVKHFGFKVSDIRTTHREMSAEFGQRVTDIQHGRTGIDYFFVCDPDGLWVELVQDDRALDATNPTYLP
jgi:glyoxylase I family protein